MNVNTDSLLKVALHIELGDALQNVEAAGSSGPGRSEEELGSYIVQVVTLSRCIQWLQCRGDSENESQLFANVLQRSLLLPALRPKSKQVMTASLSFICRLFGFLPHHAISSTNFVAIDRRFHSPETQLPNADVFRHVAYRGRQVSLELRRAKTCAQGHMRQQLIHDTILRLNYPYTGLLHLEGVHQDVKGDLDRTYLVSADYLYHPSRTHLNSLSLLIAILEALNFIHTNGIAHGRIKTSEVVFDKDGKAQLSGLGLGVLTLVPRELYPPAPEDIPLGEYLHMAPEILCAYRDGREGVPTPAGDMYSLALVAYELFSGEKPFPEARAKHCAVKGIQRLFKGVIDKNERPSRPENTSFAYTHLGMTDKIWEIIEDCWDPDPGARPTARDTLQRLFKIVEDPRLDRDHQQS